jgi:basic membrane protein A and related proteins
VDHYIAGFQAGAKEAYPQVETLNGYSQDFVDQAKCKEIALDQISKGSKVVFQVAGGCGLGALDAAQEEGVQGIGVDADQSYLGDHILTSALKKVDVAVFEAVERAQAGNFEGGTDVIATVENGGVGLGKISAEGKKYESQVQEVQDQIAAGEITDIPDTVK